MSMIWNSWAVNVSPYFDCMYLFTEDCPVDQILLNVVVSNLAVADQIGELYIYCKYGVQLGSDGVTLEPDPQGCPITVRNHLRKSVT